VVGESPESNTVSVTSIGVPKAPTITSITSIDSTISINFNDVSFNDVSYNSYSPVENYAFFINNNEFLMDSLISPFIIDLSNILTGFKYGTNYSITLEAINALGSSDKSNSITITPITLPSPPMINYISVDNGSATILFTPGNNGGSEILYYEYQYTYKGIQSNKISIGNSIEPFTIEGLTNDITHSLTMWQRNIVGTSGFSNTLSFTPSEGLPEQPTIESKEEGNQFASITFINNDVTTTDVVYSIDNGVTFTSIGLTSKNIALFGLTNGILTTIQIFTVNLNGTSKPLSVTVTPSTTPSEPTFWVSAVNETATVYFYNTSDGGKTIQNQEYSLDNITYVSLNLETDIIVDSPLLVDVTIVTTYSYTISNLTAGVTYNLYMRSRNKNGPSTTKMVYFVVSTSVTTPQLSLDFSEGSALLYLSPPIEIDTEPLETSRHIIIENKAISTKTVTGYKYTYTLDGVPTNGTYNSTVMPIVVENINAGIQFTVTAQAIYEDTVTGEKSISAESTQLPAKTAYVPAKPTFDLEKGYESATITVDPGSDNGSEITSYLYSTDNGKTYIDTDSSGRIFVIDELVGEKTLLVRIKAVNAIGSSEASEAKQFSNICFPAGTLIQTNQGKIAIEKINPKIHTIRNKKIVTITQTISLDKYLVCIEKNALGNNLPSEKTIISKNHCIWYNGKMIAAKHFVNNFENVKKVKYNGETLYNVLMEEADKMMVNNLICETLDPENSIAKLYKLMSNLSEEEKRYIINKENEYVIKNKIYK